jgi:predicted DNA-binding transcriptional regulator AlpA
MAKKKSDLNVDLAGRDALTSESVMAMLDCSKSHLYRLTRNEIGGLVSPFPRPFKIGSAKLNYWRSSQIKTWLDEQQQAATE